MIELTNKKKLLFASFVLGFLFMVMSMIVHYDFYRDTDLNSMTFLQSLITRRLDLPFSYITILGSTEITLVILFVIFTLTFFIYKRIFLGIFLYFSIFIIELASKLIIFHPEPPSFLNRYQLGFHFPSSFIVNTNFSFPSGHMARTTYLILIILYLIWLNKASDKMKKTFISLFFILVILVIFISRIYLGEHWFSDVIGGVLLGSSISFLAMSFW